MLVRPYYEVNVPVDGETLVIRVKRWNADDQKQYIRKQRNVARSGPDRMISRKPSGIEQEQHETDDPKGEWKDGEFEGRWRAGDYKVPWSKVVENRYEDMSPEERETYNQKLEEQEEQSQIWVNWVFRSFLTVKSGLEEELENESGEITVKAVHSGTDLLRIFGGREDVLTRLMALAWEENTLSEQEKKVLRSRIDSGTGSTTTPRPEPSGKRSAPIAEHARIADSAISEDAQEDRSEIPSGPTLAPAHQGSSSTNAPS